MRNIACLLVFCCYLSSCNQPVTPKIAETPAVKLKKEAIEVAKEYAMQQLKEPKAAVGADGILTIQGGQKRYTIDPATVIAGLIDQDTILDAIVTLHSWYQEKENTPEHLILLRTNGKLTLVQSVESDMKIVTLENRILTTEHHTKPKTSPLYNCKACREIITYQFKAGNLVKIESAR